MIAALRLRWREYLIEAWALGMFMASAAFFTILLEHPRFGVPSLITVPMTRHFLNGVAMGLTALAIIYSPWGKRSGAHMNPAVTLTFLTLDRINRTDAIWYILAQFVGGVLMIGIFKVFFHAYIADPAINYVTTLPGMGRVGLALGLETLLSFMLFLTVLISSNSKRWATYTGFLVAIWLILFITFESPYSGMSINPARTVASAFPAHIWTGWWLYFVGPVTGMMLAGVAYRQLYRWQHGGSCVTMRCHMSGEDNRK